MADWTNSAKAELERYCARVRESLAGSGADATEVIEDLQRHVEAEITAAKLTVVNEEDVRRILARIGEPGLPPNHPLPPAVPAFSTKVAPTTKKRPGFLLLFFGAVLPTVALFIELGTRMCASAFFDPMPTWWHTLLVALAPAFNLAVWIGVREEKVTWRPWLGRLNGFALGLSFYYFLLYLPLMIPGAIAIIFFGWGLLPLSPFFCLLCGVVLRKHLRRLGVTNEPVRLPGLWPGLAVATLALGIVAIPEPLTRFLSGLAISDSPATSARGIHWLRLLGREETLREDAYGNSFDDRFFGTVFSQPVRAESAREIYFRVTGTPFNSQPPPHSSHFSRNWGWEDFDWDAGLGGEKVAGRLKGLSLSSSRMDGLVEPDAALGYYEWTMEFKNTSTQQREARAQIQLPPGAIVSRLTLWVNGEEREAAFGGRGQVRQAYQKVAVVERHDPVLVTTCGPDRILMQCFPVPPNGGHMKIRIGITAPMVLTDLSTGKLRWPMFSERNFALGDGVKHSLWLESPAPLQSALAGLKPEQPRSGNYAIHGDLDDASLMDPEASITTKRSADVAAVWAAVEKTDQVVKQTMVSKTESAPSRLVVVVDGSAGTKEFVPAITRALRRLPENLDCAFILATDEDYDWSSKVMRGNSGFYELTANRLQHAPITGGQDNVTALVRAWDLADESTNGLMLWIHGPQPIALQSIDSLRQRFERHGGAPRLLEIQTRPGPNLALAGLDGLNSVTSLSRFGKLDDDLGGLFDRWSGHAKPYEFVRELVEKSSVPTDSAAIKPASKHIVRLQAYEEVLRLAAKHKANQASALAVATQIVTPVSGAVVLETKAQFAQAGLTPADVDTVPIIPEPQTWVILLVGGVIAGGSLRRAARRRAAR